MLVRKRLDNGWRSGALDSSREMVPTVYGMNLWIVSFYGWYKVGPVKACHKHSGIWCAKPGWEQDVPCSGMPESRKV